MMNGGHACTGALAGAATSSVLAAVTGAHLGVAGTAVGALLGAGAALLPDLDADGASAYRSAGPVTAGVGEAFQWLARFAFKTTKLPHDPNGDGEHRGLVHTPVFAALLGLLVGLGGLVSSWVTAAVMVLVIAPGIGALSRSGPAWVRKKLYTHQDGPALVVAVVIVAWLVATGVIDGLGWYAAASITVGMIVHSMGDSATRSGIPWFWPFRRRCEHCSPTVRCAGSRWRRGHILPRPLRWRVGSPVGTFVERGIEIACLAGVAVLLIPDVAALITLPIA